MIRFFIIAIAIAGYSCCFADPSLGTVEAKPRRAEQILYLMHTGRTTDALEMYQEWSAETGSHHADVLQQIGLILLDQGFRSRNPEMQLLTLFGAGISMNEKALYILEQGIGSPHPQLQLIALNLLVRFQSDDADELIGRAMSSFNPLVRLEAAHQLAQKKHPKAFAHIESLMNKSDPELLPIFPQLFAVLGDDSSIKALKKLMSHPDEEVRIEAILSAAKHGRDDLLPKIRTLASQHTIPQQEACAAALGAMKDESSVNKLLELANSKAPAVRLASLIALSKLGRKEAGKAIERQAGTGDLFAISALGEAPGSEPILQKLTASENIQVRLNAALGLLELQDPHCLPCLVELLVKDSRDLAFAKASSRGRSLSYWKAIPSARQNLQDSTVSLELSLHFREAILAKALDLPEERFLELAALIFQTQQTDLVPTLVLLLENLQTQNAVDLLKKYQQKEGAPLIRNYCNLALYRIKQDGAYEKKLQDWLAKEIKGDLIQLRPIVPWEMREEGSQYQITPHETSRLMIEAFEAFAKAQDENGINVLLEAIKSGNDKNKYALAGLLIRASL